MSDEDDVRRLALALPSTEERTAYGTPAFYVGKKMFARLHDQPGVLVCWRADLGEREALLQSDPSAFFTTPHYDGHPSVLVRLDRVPPERLGELLREAWECRAPKRITGR
ncbi:MmcQ/YjbR family DNA-binding protein [Herbiconiux sp. CPCC 205763]|uniref:MmcQ/YjbR family DNA-binding protein n=1 Tax=Herbiconiux aconitum TaxID=2970913 RepID=A0ABT2GU57_9MICO|nr:MmcQ/YjbR family DNA-binding protein [Herbiconiux aconitum]MCS5719739.1 MmcQ/YjbR family DNA-binding protein [Herbiconiux aconitum]